MDLIFIRFSLIELNYKWWLYLLVTHTSPRSNCSGSTIAVSILIPNHHKCKGVIFIFHTPKAFISCLCVGFNVVVLLFQPVHYSIGVVQTHETIRRWIWIWYWFVHRVVLRRRLAFIWKNNSILWFSRIKIHHMITLALWSLKNHYGANELLSLFNRNL